MRDSNHELLYGLVKAYARQYSDSLDYWNRSGKFIENEIVTIAEGLGDYDFTLEGLQKALTCLERKRSSLSESIGVIYRPHGNTEIVYFGRFDEWQFRRRIDIDVLAGHLRDCLNLYKLAMSEGVTVNEGFYRFMLNRFEPSEKLQCLMIELLARAQVVQDETMHDAWKLFSEEILANNAFDLIFLKDLTNRLRKNPGAIDGTGGDHKSFMVWEQEDENGDDEEILYLSCEREELTCPPVNFKMELERLLHHFDSIVAREGE